MTNTILNNSNGFDMNKINKITKFLKNYKKIFLFIIVIVLFCYLVYKFSYSNRTSTKVFEFELAFSKYINKLQLDFCNSEKYNNTILADYFVCSSYNPISTGYLKYDYVSLDMIEKTIINGCRYIELEILNKEIKNDTIPVIGIGNEEGYNVDSQNVLDCNDVFDMIHNIAFSQRYINNYHDPLFIFLNLKTKNNINTLNKLYDIIISNINHRLLDERYYNQNINLATTKICNLIDKIVILSSDGYQHSKLEEIINMSTNSSFLHRLKWDELPHKDDLLQDDDKPIVSLISKNISFTNNSISISDNTNFVDLGITPDSVLSIQGSDNVKNNTNDSLLHIKQVVLDRIILDETVLFVDEDEGESISLKIFSVNHTLKNIDKQNRSSLTIVYTQRDFFNFNYDPNTAWRLGCQFACMNFQKIDYNLKKYMKKFNRFSYLLKPTNLRNVLPKPIVLSMKNQLPDTIDNDLPILHDFLLTYENTEIKILPFANNFKQSVCCYNIDKTSNIDCSKYSSNEKECNNVGGENNPLCKFTNDATNSSKCNLNRVVLVNSNNTPKFSIVNENSNFIIEKGLDNKFNSVSIRNGNKYIVSNKSCCYLSFKQKDKTDEEYNKYASFYPVNSTCNNNDFVSFLQQIDNKNYYLKYRTDFSYKNKLYRKTTTNYYKVRDLGDYSIYKPKTEDNYKSIGHLVIKKTESPNYTTTTTTTSPDTSTLTPNKLSTTSSLFRDIITETFEDTHKNFNYIILDKYPALLLTGAVSDPIDYENIWSGSGMYLWKPIASDGYVSLGVVFTTINKKPVNENICCVASEFIKEVEYNEQSSFVYDDNGSNKLSLWTSKGTNKSHQYFVASLSSIKPSKFINPIYDFNFETKDFMDMLYIGEVKSDELESACFKISQGALSTPKPMDYINFENDIYNNKKIKNNDGKCIGLTKSYWSDIYNKNDSSQELTIVDCKSHDYSPTNFSLFLEDNTIRLADKPNYCLENSDDKLYIKPCNGTNQQQFKYINNNIVNTDIKSNSIQKCLETTEDSLVFNKCSEEASQNWSINKTTKIKCLKDNEIVYYKTIYPRSKLITQSNKKNNTDKYNYLDESIDSTNFHLYLKGKIIGTNKEDTEYWDIKLNNNLGTKKVHKNDNLLVPYDNQSQDFVIGEYILGKNGGLDIDHYNESNIKWEGRITKVVNETKVEVIYTINSIEANLNKLSLGRPRFSEKKIVNKSDIIILEPAISC